MIRYIGLDFEASGTNPWGKHMPIEIGLACVVDGRLESVNMRIGKWQWGAQGVEWDEDAYKVHQISKEDLEGCPPVGHVDILAAAWLLERGLSNRMWNVTVGWNVAGYDRQFVTRHMPALNSILSYRTADLNALIFAVAENESAYNNIKKAAKAAAVEGMPEGDVNWHNAEFDAVASLKAFDWLRAR